MNEKAMWITCTENCGKKIYVDEVSKRELHRNFVLKLCKKFNVANVIELKIPEP